MSAVRLAVVTTHPIQYYAPVFRALAASGIVEPRVFYTWSQSAGGTLYDSGFGQSISWDIPLLEGYAHEFVPNVARRPGRGFFGVRTPALTRAIETWGADAVLVFGWNSAAHLGAMRHFKGRLPVFFRGDSTLLDPSGPLARAARATVLRLVYRYVDVAIAVGENSRDYFRAFGLPDRRIGVAPHSVDNDRFADLDGLGERQAREWRETLGIPTSDVVIGFAGKFIAKKAPEILLDGFMAAGSPGHLVLFGDGSLEPLLRDRARGRRQVHILPFQNQSRMPAVYRVCDLFVLPSRGPGETWGLALNEAMASGRAVAATRRVGGARDLIREGIDGWVIEPDDVGAVAGLIRDAAGVGRSALGGMGQAARRRIAAWSTQESAWRTAEIVVRETGRIVRD